MKTLLNKTSAHKLAKSLDIRLGKSGVTALNKKIEEIMKEAALRARKARRKTILDRDIILEKDLFSFS